MDQTKKDYFQKRITAMETERSSFIPHYRELSQFIQPRMGRYFVTDRNRGDKRYQSIINSRGTQSHRSSRAGLMAGIMSPTRPWFNLETPDPELMAYQPVLDWLFKVETLLRAIFTSSNLYNMAPVALGETLLFGTACMTQIDDFENVAHFFTHTAGSYMLAQNEKFQVDTMGRKFQLSARQLVNAYGRNVSTSVMNAYDRGNYENWFDVVQFVEPNQNPDPRKMESQFKKFSSTFYEPGGEDGKLLAEQGFDEFPAHCPRWDVTGEDIYATDCPGMTALGDIKALQDLEKQGAIAVQKMVTPPLRGPASLRNIPINSLPGGATLYDDGGGQKLEPVYTVMPNMQQHVMMVQHHEARIKEAFYEDLFRSIDSMEGIQPQNQLFLSMKNAEKLLQLGPVLERLHGEFLNKIVDRTFAQCIRANLLPPAPPELQGKPLRTRYISSLAMAQRSVANTGIDQLTMFIGGLMKAGFSTAGDNFDVDESVHEYAHNAGVSPRLILAPDKVAAARQAHQQQQAQQQQMAMAAQGAAAANQGSQAVSNIADAQQTSQGGQPPR